jgi:hypothetical protein
MRPLQSLFEKSTSGPVGLCIYCGATGLPLTDEHVLLDGLGGGHVLLEASCRDCANLINREFESYVLRVLLGPFREKFGIRSGNSKKKRRPRPPQKLVLNKPDGSIVTVYPEKENMPPLLFLPIFERPGLLTGSLGNTLTWGMFQFPWEMRKYLQHHGAVSVQTPPIDNIKFARWIAKIAHAFGVTQLGDAFEPVLPRIIRGDASNILDFVGGVPEETERRQPGYLLGVGQATDAHGADVAIALIRIFAQVAAPLYMAVLGPLNRTWPLDESDDPLIVSPRI